MSSWPSPWLLSQRTPILGWTRGPGGGYRWGAGASRPSAVKVIVRMSGPPDAVPRSLPSAVYADAPPTTICARPARAEYTIVVLVQMQGAIQQPTGEVMEPVCQGERSIYRFRERQSDPHQAAELVQTVGLLVGPSEMSPQVVRL